jgi:hypothetical protein
LTDSSDVTLSLLNFDNATLTPEDERFLSRVFLVLRNCRLSEEEKQRVNKSPGLIDLLSRYIDVNRRANQYSSEEVRSNYCYPPGFKMRSVQEQVTALQMCFPELGTREDNIDKLIARPLHTSAEWAAIPRWEKLGKTYQEAVQRVLAVIASKRKFSNSCNISRLCQKEAAIDAWGELGKSQTGDILIVGTTFGLRHRGRSIRNAEEKMIGNEFGLGVFAVGCMMLTHPKREITRNQLHPECGGDEFPTETDGQIASAPFFSVKNDEMRLDTVKVDNPGDAFGCATGFLQKAV